MDLDKRRNVCHKEIVSDANNKYYCKLCGMLVDEQDVIKKIKGSINYFCCKICMKKYFAFKFNKLGS